MDELLTIGEVARRAGLRTSAIRYYEQMQLLPEPRRSSGHRRYTPDVLRQLSFIQVAQAAGLTVQEIRVLTQELDGSVPLSERWHTLAARKLIEVDALIQRAHGMKRLLEQGLRCGCATIDECIDCIRAQYDQETSAQ